MLVQGLFDSKDNLPRAVSDLFEIFVVIAVNNHIQLSPRARLSMVVIAYSVLASNLILASSRWFFEFPF